MVRRDDRPLVEVEPPERGRELVEACLELQVDVQADRRRLLGEERECLVERRELGRDLAQLVEPQRAHRAGLATVAHLVEVVGVSQDEGAAWEVEHVELDEVDPVLDGGTERGDRVLRRDVGRAAMPDPEHRRAVRSPELDHAAPRRTDLSHHQASGTSTSAWPTVITAARTETSSQKRSG